MNKAVNGYKTVSGLLTVLIVGALTVGVSHAADDAGKKKKAKGKPEQAAKAINTDEMVTIPAGKFIFGKGDSQQEITLPEYSIDKYEVTNAQYAKVKADYKYPSNRGDFPVIEVSQVEADAHCKAAGKRLPTEQEWEKAARGTDGRAYPWGNEFDERCAVTSETANEGEPMAVGSCEKGKSPYGVMDMAGNVWEWTSSYTKDDQRYVVLRGGSYFEDGSFAAVTSTIRSIPVDRKGYVGFRCVKDAK